MQLWIKSDTPPCLLNFKSQPRIYLLPKCVYFSGIKCISQMLLKLKGFKLQHTTRLEAQHSTWQQNISQVDASLRASVIYTLGINGNSPACKLVISAAHVQ